VTDRRKLKNKTIEAYLADGGALSSKKTAPGGCHDAVSPLKNCDELKDTMNIPSSISLHLPCED
jgi:hypothetical protein